MNKFPSSTKSKVDDQEEQGYCPRKPMIDSGDVLPIPHLTPSHTPSAEQSLSEHGQGIFLVNGQSPLPRKHSEWENGTED